MSKDLIQAPADRDANAVRSPEDEKPVAWRFRIGMQNLWSYTVTKSDAEWHIKQSGIKKYELQPLFLAAATAVRDKVMEWKTIDTAPKDGTLIDVWCDDAHTGDEGFSVRLTNVAWHEANEIFPHTGWIRVTDDGNYDLVESPPTSILGLPAWRPTHYMLLPSPPCVPDRRD